MIPSTLAAEVSGVLRDFLSTGFGPSNPALSDVVKDCLDDSDNLLEGPCLSVDLPFQRAPEGGSARCRCRRHAWWARMDRPGSGPDAPEIDKEWRTFINRITNYMRIII